MLLLYCPFINIFVYFAVFDDSDHFFVSDRRKKTQYKQQKYKQIEMTFFMQKEHCCNKENVMRFVLVVEVILKRNYLDFNDLLVNEE